MANRDLEHSVLKDISSRVKSIIVNELRIPYTIISAEISKTCGKNISQQNMSNWLRGKHAIPMYFIIYFCKVYSINPSYILFGEPEPIWDKFPTKEKQEELMSVVGFIAEHANRNQMGLHLAYKAQPEKVLREFTHIAQLEPTLYKSMKAQFDVYQTQQELEQEFNHK